MGHPSKQKQLALVPTNWKHQFTHGGILRQKRIGRFQRPLSTKDPIHLVLKAHRDLLKESSFRGKKSFMLCHWLIKKYSKKFFVKIDQLSIQGDHLHILVRCSRRSHYLAFFRVLAGQIAQVFERQGLLKPVTDTPKDHVRSRRLWKYRPFSRVVRSFNALRIVKDYIQLNEMEAKGRVKYNSKRLSGLSSADWKILWS